MAKIIEITRGQQELNGLLAKNAYVLVDHYIEGCEPCEKFARYLKVLVKELDKYVKAGHIIFAKMDAEGTPENEEYCEDKGLRAFPHVSFYNADGQLREYDMPIDESIKTQILSYLDTDGVVV